MEYEFFTTKDNTSLAYQTSLQINPSAENGEPLTALPTPPLARAQTSPLASTCLLLMHGFSGSSEYFVHNFSELSTKSWVVAPDMRGHGRSQRTRGGYHVARLACDLFEFVQYLRTINPSVRIYPVGCSIGAAVLWTYIELFGNTLNNSNNNNIHNNIHNNIEFGPVSNQRRNVMFNGMVFVDQAPLQDRTEFGNWDSSMAHYGLYDEDTLLEAQKAWSSEDPETRTNAHQSLVDACLGYRAQADPSVEVSIHQQRRDEAFFMSISAECDGIWLARLMADHTRYDHREAIEDIDVPVLVMAGERSGCFPVDGMLETVTRVNHGKDRALASASIFPCGHWLFYEDPERFNREVLDFLTTCETKSEAKSTAGTRRSSKLSSSYRAW